MKHTLLACALLGALMPVLNACDDETGNIGISVMPSTDQTTTSQALFPVPTTTIETDSMVAYTSTCHLGRVTDPETGATTTADFMAQFATLEDDNLPALSAMHKEDGQVVADSILLNLYIQSYYGDSINSMKMGVYELDSANILPEGQKFYTDVDPAPYLNPRPDAIRRETSFAVTDLSVEDTVRFKSSYSKNIRVKLPTDYGTRILRKYYSNPEYFHNSYSFIRNVCPGFYFKTLSGNGTMVDIDITTLTVYFRFTAGDSTYVGIKRVAATGEVIQCNSFQNKDLTPLLQATDYTFVKAPVALATELTLPVDSIFQNHQSDSINSARIVFSRYNNGVSNAYSLPTPQQLLMLPKEKMYSYFEDREVPDGTTSYTATFSSSYNSYTFSNIAPLLTYLRSYRNREAGVSDSDTEALRQSKINTWMAAHPDWNKMVLIPVTTALNSQSQIIDVYPDMSLSSVKLVGSDSNPVTITVVYSSFNE